MCVCRYTALTGALRCRAQEGQQEAELPQALQDPEEGEARPGAAPGAVFGDLGDGTRKFFALD